jgi:hypothetical protein
METPTRLEPLVADPTRALARLMHAVQPEVGRAPDYYGSVTGTTDAHDPRREQLFGDLYVFA